jgi:ATP-dependent DNA ligase
MGRIMRYELSDEEWTAINTVWVEPKLMAKIEFRGITEDGMLRHPSFKGLD